MSSVFCEIDAKESVLSMIVLSMHWLYWYMFVSHLRLLENNFTVHTSTERNGLRQSPDKHLSFVLKRDKIVR